VAVPGIGFPQNISVGPNAPHFSDFEAQAAIAKLMPLLIAFFYRTITAALAAGAAKELHVASPPCFARVGW
jgi:hypothetical protein